ncbi:hypothetical protein ACFQE1_01595 [Halobium palmae]|uniref:Uncharacterized protein n=1 Tax=Halobium palmae TaxID=1776492 RepID=A0ABD5RUJ3_9EURY
MTWSSTRRRLLQLTGTATIAALPGCNSSILTGAKKPEYTLNIQSIDSSPVEHALYEPGDGIFGQPARTALQEILPTGRYTTYGYTSIPGNEYVEHDSAYYQTENTVTGRKNMTRTVVRVSTVNKENVPDDAILIDSLDRVNSRVIKILHSYSVSNGESSSADLLHEDAYVLRRPVEKDSRFVTGDLNGRVVTMTESGTWAYRVHVTREEIMEPANTVLSIPVAESREAFREVVFGSRIDSELAPENVSPKARRILNKAIRTEQYTENAPLSPGFERLLDLLGIGNIDSKFVNGQLLWYDDRFYRYSLYINDPS